MKGIQDLFQQVHALVNRMGSSNEVWHFILAAGIVIAGFLLLELLWRYTNRRAEHALEKKGVKQWAPYVTGFIPSFRLAFAALLLRVAAMPLALPPQVLSIIRGIEMFLLFLAVIWFFFHLVDLFDILARFLRPDLREKVEESMLKNLKGILRLTGIVVMAFLVMFLQRELFPAWVWKSPLWRYVLLALVAVLLFAGGKMLIAFLQTMTVSLRDTEEKTRLRLVLAATFWPIRLLVCALAVYAAQELLPLPDTVNRFADTAVKVVAVLVLFLFFYRLLDVVEYELTKFVKREDNEFDLNLVQMVRIITRVIVIVFGAIYLLKAATGKPMTTLLAGLGIGGLAVALAAQDTLKNLFGSFMLMADKPFAVGDWIYVEGTHGTVEEIGFRSTRIRTFPGNLISVPNEKMASLSIENVQRRPYIRRSMNITVTYDTAPEKVDRAVQIVKEILARCPELDPSYPPKVHFSDFNDASLNVLVVYWFRGNNYWASVAFNEQINFEILRRFNDEGIEFAFPTTTTYLAQDDRRPLSIALSDRHKPEMPLFN